MGLLAPLACSSGTANNTLGTAGASTNNTTSVIASFANGEALERRALDSNGGFVVDQWPYSQALGQQWRLVPQADGSVYLMNIASGKALSATGAGNALQEADVSTGDALKWQVTAQSDGRLSVIKHVQTGLCLEAGSANAAVGAAAHVATCSSAGTQQWVVQSLNNLSASQLVFNLVDNASGNLLRATANGSVQLGAADGSRYEQWQLVNHDDGTMSVTNLATGQTLQGLQGVDTLGTPAQAPTAAGQTWRMTGASSTQYAFMSANDGTCMVSTGAAVSQGPCAAQGGWTVQVTNLGAPIGGTGITTGPSPTPTPTPTPTQTPGTNPSLVYPWDTGGPVISDIMQGTVNDCWLLAALSTVVYSDPSFITNHITTNNDGTYTVTIYPNGQAWNYTTGYVAANVAYPPNTKWTLANQRTGSNGRAVFWPSLYEQAALAYAQANPGAYSTVNDRYLDTSKELYGYALITNASWSWSDYDASNDDFWTTLSYANNKIPVSVATLTPQGTGSDQFADGVLGDHFYAVLKTAGTSANRTVTVRNPWGSRAPNVTDATNLGDGTMTMLYSTFVTEFFEVQRAASISGPP